MFSSLPSASKIYVSSAKSRQKNTASSKGRKKKIHSTSSDTRVTDATLVSQIGSDFDFHSVESSSETYSDIHHRLIDDTSSADALLISSCNALPEDSVGGIQMILGNDLADSISEQCQNDTSMLGNTFTKSNVNSNKHSAEVDGEVSEVSAASNPNIESVLESVATDCNVESISENVQVGNFKIESMQTDDFIVQNLSENERTENRNADNHLESTVTDDFIVENPSESERTENRNSDNHLESTATDDLGVGCLSMNAEKLIVESTRSDNFDEDQLKNERIDVQDVSAVNDSEGLPSSNDSAEIALSSNDSAAIALLSNDSAEIEPSNNNNAIKLESELDNAYKEIISDCAIIDLETELDDSIEAVISDCEASINSTADVTPERSTVPYNVLSVSVLPSEQYVENHCNETDAPKWTDSSSSQAMVQSNNELEGEIVEGSHSPEHSELSGTESALCESKSSSLGFENKSTDETSCVFETEKIQLTSVDTCQSYDDLGSIQTSRSDLKRCSSLPKSLKETSVEAPHLNFLDKATFTGDFLCQYCGSAETLLNGQNGSKVASEEESTNGFRPSLLTSTGVSAKLDKESSRNVLPPLTTAHARARSYVFGSTGHTGSLLGSEELNRFFPDSQVTIFVGTWNMNSHNPPQSIDDFLLPLDVPSLPDIYAIGVQESMQSKFEWDVLVQSTLGPSHVLFASSSLGVLHLSVYIRRDLIWFCSEPEDASVATRPGTMVKTKGAVAVCFMFFGTSLLFVNSHLAAHEQKLKERLLDYEKICSSLDLPKSIPLKANQRDKDVTSRFDVVLWCGDLNFRVTRDRPSVLSFVEQRICKSRPSCSFLVKHDQLYKAMQEGAAFNGFKEGVIHFNPSYKFEVGTNTFNSTKLRVPSYTDRILYRSNERSSVTCLHYDAVPDILTSDHKPVFGVFKVALRPGRDNVPLAAGMFKRDIYLEAIKRRTQFLGVRQGQSTICNMM